MNLIILFDEDFITSSRVHITDRRREHVYSVHKAQVGDQLTVGKLNGLLGRGEVIEIDKHKLILDVALSEKPPIALPLTLVLALPRPNMLKRSLQTCSTMGVKRIVLLNSQRVEKSFWQSPQLQDENIRSHFLLGLEQAKDTVLPELIIENNFVHFINHRLAELTKTSRAFVAHPHSSQACPHDVSEQTTLIIGPEGGFLQKEIEQLETAGCTGIHIGKRILRVETAIPVLLSKLFY